MKIQVCYSAADAYAGEIVQTALIRAFTPPQVSQGDFERSDEPCVVWINPPGGAAAVLAKILRAGSKAVVLGRVHQDLADVLGLHVPFAAKWLPEWTECRASSSAHHDVSPAFIRYDSQHPLARLSPWLERPLCRFDFADEWNNLGFGPITVGDTPWSLAMAAGVGAATRIAEVIAPDDTTLAYAALHEASAGAALWFNRAVGPVDSLEWRLVECFLSGYRADDLPCLPTVSEVPAGFAGAACARLDCDEAVSASRPVWETYRDNGLPLSLALLTGQSLDEHDCRFMGEVIASGGSVVSHSVRHLPNWGGSYEQACLEAAESRRWIEDNLPAAAPVRYAVSPFHQNPRYAVAALADQGYRGFAAGIIANDPEYLLGRAGRAPFAPSPIVSLSTQCMLHGDCYRRYGNSIEPYCQSFDAHQQARAIFGYLDHPFSARYQYGWPDEATRLSAHQSLIDHINRQSNIWWASLGDIFDFLCYRDAALVEIDGVGTLKVETSSGRGQRPLAIEWKGRQFEF